MDCLPANSTSPVKIPKPLRLLNKEGSNLFMGSCFTENLYHYYQNSYIDCLFSPFGNIYNPLSLSNALQLLCHSNRIDEKDVFIHRGLWRHFDFDSRLCSNEKDSFLSTINNSLAQAREYLKSSTYLFLTMGTSYVYKNMKTGNVVNNCHKLPGKDFKRVNTSVSLMRESMSSALNNIIKINPQIQIILTLSPVRHLRDKATENSLSKARLRCLIDELSEDFDFWYFPAYEILLDQLRDYRWYDKDLVHPSEIAVDYIMERFIESSATDDFKNYLKDIKIMNNLLNHRVLHESEESSKFRQTRLRRFKELIEQYPELKNLKHRFDALSSDIS